MNTSIEEGIDTYLNRNSPRTNVVIAVVTVEALMLRKRKSAELKKLCGKTSR